MAKFMKPGILNHMCSMAILAVAAIMASPWNCLAGTDGMIDPTQPPMIMTPSGVGVLGAVGEPAGPVLQSVLMAPGRKIAVISGQPVQVGGKYGDAVLIRITDQEAALRNTDGTLQILKMHPAVEKKIIVQPQQSVPITHKTKRPVSQTAPNPR